MTAEPVRVLHLVKGLGPGGAERLLVSVAAASRATEVHYEVAYVLPWKQHLVPQLEDLGVKTHLLGSGAGLKDPRWLGRLRSLASSFDVVHVHSPAPGALARPLIRTLRHTCTVSTEHNVWSSHSRATRVANALTLPLDRVRWAVSAEVVESEWRPWRRRAEVLTYGIPAATIAASTVRRAEARDQMGWEDDAIVVATVANLRATKDYPTLIDAADRATRNDPRLRFIAIGQGPLEAELRARLESLRMGDRFQLVGYHPDPAELLAGADMFVLASRHEGLPISLLEAMALGLPCVATRVGGVPEVITSGEDGMLVPPGDPRSLASALEQLANTPTERRRLSSAARQRAATYDISSAARILEERYRSITLV